MRERITLESSTISNFIMISRRENNAELCIRTLMCGNAQAGPAVQFFYEQHQANAMPGISVHLAAVENPFKYLH